MSDAAAPVLATRAPDILVRTAPSLSATVDSPLGEVAKPPVSASNDAADQGQGISGEMTPQDQAESRKAKVTDPDAPVDDKADTKPGAKAKPDEGQEAGEEGDEDIVLMEDGKPVETPPYVKREITKARNQQRAATKAADDARAAAKAATDALLALQAEHAALRKAQEDAKPPEPVKVDATPPRPTRDQFDDPDAYDEAVISWSKAEGVREAEAAAAAAKAAAEALTAKTEREAAEQAHKTQVEQIEATWKTRREAALVKYPDYEAVAESDAVSISDPMAAAILQSENGTDIAYHLGQNPEEAARIAKLPNVALQMIEIGKLSAKLSTPAPRQARLRPIEPLDTGTSPAGEDTRELDMDSYAKKRHAELVAIRRPFFERPEPGRRAVRH